MAQRTATKYLGALAASTTLLASAACSTTSPTSNASDTSGPLKVGLLVPLTGSLAEAGSWIQEGVKYGVQQVNAAGGVNHRKIQLVTVDTAGDPTQAVTDVNKLVTQDQVQFIIGPITSDAMTAVLPIENQHGIASIPVVGSTELTPKKMPYGFSMLLNAADQSAAMVNYAKSKGYTRVAILHDNGEQGLSANTALKADAARAGMTVTGNQQYTVGDTNVSAQVLSLKRGNPQAVLLFPTDGTDVGHVLEAMKSLDWNVPVIGGYGAHYSTQIAQVSGAGSMASLTATVYAPFGACPGHAAPTATKKYIAAIKAFDPKAFPTLALDLAAASTDSVSIMKQGIEGAGSTSGAKFASWMNQDASSISGLVNPSVSASSSSHFLFGPSDMVLVNPGKQVSTGVYERTDC